MRDPNGLHRSHPIDWQRLSSLDQSTTTGKVDPIERRVTGVHLYAKQALTLVSKRLSFNYRNMHGLITQILLPAFFITMAMPVALAAPRFADPPPIILSTVMLSHSNSLHTHVSGLNTHKLKNRQAQMDDTLNVSPFQNRTRLTLNDFTDPLRGKIFEDLPLPFDDGDVIKWSRYSPTTTKKKNQRWTWPQTSERTSFDTVVAPFVE